MSFPTNDLKFDMFILLCMCKFLKKIKNKISFLLFEKNMKNKIKIQSLIYIYF